MSQIDLTSGVQCSLKSDFGKADSGVSEVFGDEVLTTTASSRWPMSVLMACRPISLR